MNKLALSLAIAMAVTGCKQIAVNSKDEATAPAVNKGGFMGLTTMNNVEVDNESAFKGNKDVVIGSFKVGFLTYKKTSSTAQGGLFGGGAGKATARANLVGATDKEYQAVADAAYADFQTKMKEAGYNIVSRDKITGLDEYKGISKETSPYKIESDILSSSSDDYVFVAPQGMDLHFYGEAGKMGGFAFSNPMAGYTEIATEQKIPVVSVSYIVSFVNSDSSGGYWASSATVDVGQGISITPGSGVSFFSGQGGTFNNGIGSAKLGQPVFSQEKFATVTDSTSDTEVAAGIAANVVSLIGGMGTRQSREYEIKADPAKFEAVATKVAKDANQQLVSKMAALR